MEVESPVFYYNNFGKRFDHWDGDTINIASHEVLLETLVFCVGVRSWTLEIGNRLRLVNGISDTSILLRVTLCENKPVDDPY